MSNAPKTYALLFTQPELARLRKILQSTVRSWAPSYQPLPGMLEQVEITLSDANEQEGRDA